MIDKFWEGVGSHSAEKWIDYLVNPASLFWLAGGIVYVLNRGLGDIQIWLTSFQPVQQVMLIVIGLLILAFSSFIMRDLHIFLLRFIEGSWPWPFSYFSVWVGQYNWRVNQARNRNGVN